MASFLCFTFLFISIHTADGFLEYIVDRCEFNSTELKDMEYIYSHYYNKIEYIRFSSSVGHYVGVAEFGENLAEIWNNDTERLNSMRLAIATYCQHNIEIHDRAIIAKSVQPSVRIKSKTPLSGQHPAMLVCSVYDFFPSEIKVRWLRDGQEVTSDVTSTEVMANGDWYYQTHSYLQYTPRSGEKISCVVEHASLSEPLITDWDPSFDQSASESTTLTAIGASILTLGLILLLGGFIFYRWKARAWSGFLLRTEGQTYHSVHMDISEDCVLLREMCLEIQTQRTARHTLRVDKRCKRIEKPAVSKIRWYMWT